MTARFVLVCALLISACGGDGPVVGDSMPPTTTSATTEATTTFAASIEPLSTYRFTMSLSVVPIDGDPRAVEVLDGEAVVATGAMRIFGNLAGLPIDLATDGERWQDLEQPDLELGADGVRDFLVLTGILMPDHVVVLTDDAGVWEEVGTERHLGAPATHLRRTGIENGVDWDLGGGRRDGHLA